VTEIPIELDKHRGMAAQKATDIRRVIAEVEANAKLLRDKQGVVEIEILAVPAISWPEAAGVASELSRYLVTTSAVLDWARRPRLSRGADNRKSQRSEYVTLPQVIEGSGMGAPVVGVNL
jgi:hypothetical protein